MLLNQLQILVVIFLLLFKPWGGAIYTNFEDSDVMLISLRSYMYVYTS